MRQIFKKLLFLPVCVLLWSAPALAWNDTGHQITGYIAWQRLSPQARENVIRILRSAPEDSHLGTFYAAFGAEPESVRQLEYFMLVPTWADIARDRSFPTRYRKYNHSDWHYDDIFWKQVNGQVEVLKGFEEGGQAVPQMIEAERVIGDPKSSDAAKAIAIAWLMHLGGDIHQPLHTSARVTDLEPKGDQGGNLFLLTPAGTPRDKQVNLHWFWDSIIDRTIPIRPEACGREYIASVAKRITKAYPFGSLQPKLGLGKYEDWRNESFVYANAAIFTPDLIRHQMPSRQYQKRAFKLAEQQLALAGYRLGETLNAILSTPPAPAK